MLVAYWCLLIMIIFPYFFTTAAKISQRYNNAEPRQYLASLTGWRQRANFIQLNSFETTPAFGLAVIIAHLTQAPLATLNLLAVVYVISRVFYAICYLANKASLRTLCWLVGLGCIIGLFCIALYRP